MQKLYIVRLTDEERNILVELTSKLKPHLKKRWVIAPKYQAEFVARMEDILAVYQRPLNQSLPVVCMDEQPVQMVKETRAQLPMMPGHTQKYDFEYERNGSTNIFMFTEPLAGWRKAVVPKRKTSQDWAHEIKNLLDIDYADHEKIVLVCDNLSTHKLGSLYATFTPEEARRLAERLEIHFTPKHGSWLNIAEIELSALTKQCLDRIIPDEAILTKEVATWNQQRNKKQSGINWQFTNEKARVKLKKLYPQIQA